MEADESRRAAEHSLEAVKVLPEKADAKFLVNRFISKLPCMVIWHETGTRMKQACANMERLFPSWDSHSNCDSARIWGYKIPKQLLCWATRPPPPLRFFCGGGRDKQHLKGMESTGDLTPHLRQGPGRVHSQRRE